ncbi:MAG: hypothetical protein ACXABN_18610 [Candidatus Thorarchaeota archaeon]
MQTIYQDFTTAIYNLFKGLSDALIPMGIPFGPLAWFFIVTMTPMFLIIVLLVVRGRRGSAGSDVSEGIKKIIASTGDVSAGMAGAKKLKFLKTPAQALVFLKVEENAIEQALSAIDYYHQQGDIDESVKDKLTGAYQDRLTVVKSALAKDEQLKEIVDTSSAVDRARSDYLAKLAAMSGTAVEDDTGEAGPTKVGMPAKVDTAPPSGEAPSGAAPSGPPGGAPGGGAPSGGPPGGGPPGGGAPSGGPPGGGPPGGGAPSGPPGGAAPSGGAPDGPSDAAPSGPPGGETPSGPPSGGAPSGGTPGGAAPPKAAGGKSSLQSEMLAEMERLKALMGGD